MTLAEHFKITPIEYYCNNTYLPTLALLSDESHEWLESV